jgi:alpha-aminoadipic semialdehyde synthase
MNSVIGEIEKLKTLLIRAGNQFRPFVPGRLSADCDSSLDASGLPPEVKRAVIVYKGQLTGGYEYLNRYLNL